MKQIEREERLQREREKEKAEQPQPSKPANTDNTSVAPKEYNIWFTVDFQRIDKADIDANTLGDAEKWTQCLQPMFEGKLINVRTRVKSKLSVFNLKFGVNVQLNEPPADYINRFEDIIKNNTLRHAVENALGNAFTVEVGVWEANYEKLGM